MLRPYAVAQMVSAVSVVQFLAYLKLRPAMVLITIVTKRLTMLHLPVPQMSITAVAAMSSVSQRRIKFQPVKSMLMADSDVSLIVLPDLLI